MIAVLSSRQSEQYIQVIEGFEHQVKKRFPKAEVVRYFLQKKTTQNTSVLQEIKTLKPGLVLTLGSGATQAGLTSIPETPIVATMIIDEQILAQSSRATGVLLSFPLEVHIQWLRRFLPKVNRPAILYNPEGNSQLTDEINKMAKKSGMQINPIPVKSVKELPAALKSLGRKADMLLAMPDKTVYSGKTAKAILLSTFRNRIPFAGLSPAWVKAGALYSFCWDYKDIGRQCAVIAGKILTGTQVSKITPAAPEKTCYVINLKTADHMRVRIDPTLIKEATNVYK